MSIVSHFCSCLSGFLGVIFEWVLGCQLSLIFSCWSVVFVLLIMLIVVVFVVLCPSAVSVVCVLRSCGCAVTQAETERNTSRTNGKHKQEQGETQAETTRNTRRRHKQSRNKEKHTQK